jgi:hypothetical protein
LPDYIEGRVHNNKKAQRLVFFHCPPRESSPEVAVRIFHLTQFGGVLEANTVLIAIDASKKIVEVHLGTCWN